MSHPLPSKGGLLLISKRFLRESGLWLVVAILVLAMARLTTSPAYAWWFTGTPATSITPVHQQGLVISPITAAIVPQFIIHPLAQTVVEQPPTATATPAPALTKTPIATPTPTPRPTKAAVIVPASTNFSSVAERILELVNQQRTANGLVPLTLNTTLTNSAQAYAQLMSSQHFFSHVAPNGMTFKQRNEAAGYTNWLWMGENIAYGQTSPEMVMSDWMNSPEHKANILNVHAKELGVGYAAGTPSYWVQEFGEPQ